MTEKAAPKSTSRRTRADTQGRQCCRGNRPLRWSSGIETEADNTDVKLGRTPRRHIAESARVVVVAQRHNGKPSLRSLRAETDASPSIAEENPARSQLQERQCCPEIYAGFARFAAVEMIPEAIDGEQQQRRASEREIPRGDDSEGYGECRGGQTWNTPAPIMDRG